MENIYCVEEFLNLLIEKDLIMNSDINEKNRRKIVTNITYNSKNVTNGSIFIATGRAFKEEYIAESINKGAVCIISEGDFSIPIGYGVKVRDINDSMAACSNMFFNEPWEKLDIIGVTGTKGKSTVTYFLKEILKEHNNGKKQAHFSGITNYYGDKEEKSKLTTPMAIDLYNYMAESVKNDIKQLVMEVSSQGLKYGRVAGITFDIGCFLNFGEDHISGVEHSDLEDYLKSKMILMKNSKCSVINMDDEVSQYMLDAAESSQVNEKIITFSLNNKAADIYGYDVKTTNNGLTFKVDTPRFKELEIVLSIKGEFNVMNALCAIGVCESLKITKDAMVEGLKKASVPGRMNIYTFGDSEKVAIVDYAHNLMSFRALFDFVEEEYPNREVAVVFGCTGMKAENRRYQVGRQVALFANKCFVTENQSGGEDPAKIFNEIVEGINSAGGTYEVIPNNNEAIKAAYYSIPYNGILLVTCGIT